MSEKELEIFELCERLAKLLGDKEAIANLKILQERHPEMFKDMQEVSKTIKEVVSEPEIIVNATHSNKDKEIYKAAKKLDDKRMGDVVIKNESGLNEIFHANKKNIKEFERLQKQVEAGSRFAHFLHPDLKSAWAGSNEHSPADKSISQNNLSLEEKLTHLTNNQNYIENLPRARDILNQPNTMNLQNQEKESNQQLNNLQDSNQESKTNKFKKHR